MCVYKEENEMYGVHSTYGGHERRIQGFSVETWGNKTVDPGVDGRIILKMDLQEVV
jgi:hypothetical protein